VLQPAETGLQDQARRGAIPAGLKEALVKLSAPKFIWWVISLVLGVLALLAHFAIPGIANLEVWFWLVGLGLLLLATAIKGM
jgi:hypothetical protein